MLRKLLVWGGLAYGVYWYLKKREEQGLGQVPRPRWGYRHNVEQYNRGLSPPGSCPTAPRGSGLRAGSRQYYQPGR